MSTQKSFENVSSGSVESLFSASKPLNGLPLQSAAQIKRVESSSVLLYSLELFLNQKCDQRKNNSENESNNFNHRPQHQMHQAELFILQLLQDQIHVVHGTYSQFSRIFTDRSRGRQCAAISIYAMGYAEIHPVKTWTTDVINTLLIEGDKLYLQSKIRSADKREKYLSLDELPATFEIDGKMYRVQVNYDDIDFYYASCGYLSVDGLVDGFHRFFSQKQSKGLLLAKLYFITFYKEENYYYVFDSHPRDANGLNYDTKQKTTAVLIRFNNIENMAELIARNLNNVDQWQRLDDFRSEIHMDRTKKEPIQFQMEPISVHLEEVIAIHNDKSS